MSGARRLVKGRVDVVLREDEAHVVGDVEGIQVERWPAGRSAKVAPLKSVAS